MDRTTFRILDTLSRNLGRHVSINELTRMISRLHGTAYYKNIYDKVQELSGRKLLKTIALGNTCQVSLNLDSPELSTLLAEMEYEKKRSLMGSGNRLLALISELDKEFRHFLIGSISIIRPLKAASMNRVEFLFILPDPKPLEINERPEPIEDVRRKALEERIAIHSATRRVGERQNIRLDPLILEEKELISLLDAKDPTIKEMFSEQVTFFRPEDFWIIMKDSWRGKEPSDMEINPARISDRDMAYSLERFGYREFGASEAGKEISLEYIITSILLSDDARRNQAIPVLLSKNRPRYSLLLFLCQKYSRLERLLGILNALEKIKPSPEVSSAIKILNAIGIREEKAGLKGIKKKMELYHAI